MIKAAKRVHKVYRCLGEYPFTTSALLVQTNAGLHFLVENLGCSKIDKLTRCVLRFCQRFGME